MIKYSSEIKKIRLNFNDLFNHMKESFSQLNKNVLNDSSEDDLSTTDLCELKTNISNICNKTIEEYNTVRRQLGLLISLDTESPETIIELKV